MSFGSWVRIVLWSVLVGGVVAITAFLLLDWTQPGDVSIEAMPVGTILISIDGAVATPGVFALASGARLFEAIAAAGGMTAEADVSGLNLAGRIGDGEHITIPKAGSAPIDGGGAATPATGSPDHLIDINAASVAELDQLPGVGPVIAQRIVDFREANGPFDTVDQLEEVEGISESTVDELRHLVTTGD